MLGCRRQPVAEFIISSSGMRFHVCSLSYHGESRHNNGVVNCGAR